MNKRNHKNKVILVSVLGLLVFGVLSLNELILRTDLNNDSSDRTPASEIYRTLRSGSFTAERKLASQLSIFKEKTMASLGHAANPFDQFRFGILEGKYALTVEGEKVKDVAFVEAAGADSAEAPTRISDRVAFLKQHAQILNIKNSIEKVATDIRGAKIVETYRANLKDSGSQVYVKVEVDELDRLYNIQVL